MMMQGQIRLLGTGASPGIPAVGCHCAVCSSHDVYNQRLRSSALVQVAGKSILIDAGPDLRQQALCYGIEHLDGVIITHTHYDHTGGIDELRTFYFRSQQPLLCLLSQSSLDDLQKRFYYLFTEKNERDSLTVRLAFQLLQEQRGAVDFLGLKLSYVTYEQGGMLVNGFRFGDLAYISDIRTYPQNIFDDLKGVRTLILSALRHDPSPMHFNLTEALAFAHRVGAEMTWLTHIAHDLDHASTNAKLPPNVQLAYDGLECSFRSV